MPLITRSVSPVDLCRHRLPASVQQDELECITNGTLANLIRQLSSLSRHAENIFSDVHREILKIDHRSNTLFLRVERLAQKLAHSQNGNSFRGALDQGLEEGALRKAFKSCNIIDQHSLDRQTLPQSLQEQYQNCDGPPQLNQLNPYREDEKEALRYYTDPSYFFELWRQEMLKECSGGSNEKKRTGRSPTSPSRQRRRQQREQQSQHLPLQQQNALFAYHVSSRSSDYSRFTPSFAQHNSHQNKSAQNLGTGRFSAPAAKVLQFPAEYQAPQSLLTGIGVVYQPPPGMSMVTNTENWAQQRQTDLIAKTCWQEQPTTSSTLHQHCAVGISSDTIDQIAHKMQTVDFARTNVENTVSGECMPFLDDDDDELPPPPPQNILSSTKIAAHFPIDAVSPSSSTTLMAPSLVADVFSNEASNSGVEINSSAIDKSVQSLPQHPIPPPPPPPPTNFSIKIPSIEGNQTFGERDANPTNIQRKISTTSNTTQDSRSLLLVQIQEGVKLKRVQQREEIAEKRAIATSNDVAAILRKRMEHCLGDSDSSSGGTPAEDNEWDD